MATEILGLPTMEAAQNQKYLTHNQALSYIDGLINLTVFNLSTTTPPVSPSPGDRYVVGIGATGVWSGEDNKIAIFVGTNWVFFTPSEGWRAYDQGSNEIVVFDRSSWVELSVFLNRRLASSPKGAEFKFVQEEEIVSFSSGAIVSSTIFYPNRSIPIFASLFNVSEITGPAGIQWYGFEFGSKAIAFENGFSGNTTASQQQNGPANPVKPAFSDLTVDFEDFSVAAGAGTGTAFTGGSATLTIGYLESEPANS